MTPAARVQASIEILDDINEGRSAEQAISAWARNSRFAGSKDRAAVRDNVYAVLRRKHTCATVGGGANGRALMIGLLRQQGVDPAGIFTGEGYAPMALEPHEMTEADVNVDPMDDLPDWIRDQWDQSLGDQAHEVAQAMRDRAEVFLRVNLILTTRDAAIEALAEDGIIAEAHPTVETALIVREGARKVANSISYQDGLVELQDAHSQASVCVIPREAVTGVLDYCAGGGGKSLALAGWLDTTVHAHDAFPRRMKDLPTRSNRAQADIVILDQEDMRDCSFDIVFCDVPCSGSGSWRRDPEGKWSLSPEKLNELQEVQRDILQTASGFVTPEGYLAYATCSVLRSENHDQVDWFLSENPQWIVTEQVQFVPNTLGDGFFVTLLKRR